MKLLNLKNKPILFYIIIICILLVPAVFSLLRHGFFQSDDGTWMIVRFSAFYEALRSGQFPVRYLPRLNFGYGYPVADFLYPLFMYLAVPIHVIGFGFINSVKVILALSIFGSGIFCFLWLRKLFSSLAAIVGAVAYGLFPYHLWDIYKRGSVGEVLALALVPFIFWQIERESISLTAFGIGLLIISHNVIALFFLPILFLYLLFIKKQKLFKLFLTFVIGLGISAFFWLPALFDKQFTVFDKTQISDVASYFIYPKDFLLFGLPTLLGLISLIYFARKEKEGAYWFFLYTIILSIFLALPISGIVWDLIPIKNFIQFPFRFLSVTLLCVSFSFAALFDKLKTKHSFFLALVFLFVIFISALNFFTPLKFEDNPDSYYSTNLDTTTVKNEYMPIWVKNIPTSIPSQVVVGNGVVISQLQSSGSNILFQTVANLAGTVNINQIYFPGYVAFIDNQPAQIFYNNPQSIMQIRVPAGTHTLHVFFSETPLRLFSDGMTICSLLLLVVLIFLKRKKYAIF